MWTYVEPLRPGTVLGLMVLKCHTPIWRSAPARPPKTPPRIFIHEIEIYK